MSFLFSLPVSRTRLFLTKFTAAGVLLSIAVLWVELVRWVAHLFNAGSFDGHTFRWDWALIDTALSLAVAWISLGYATFLAAFRRFGLLIGALVATLLTILSDERPALRPLSPIEILRVEFFDSVPLISYRTLVGHAVAAAGLSAFAGWLWVGREGNFSKLLSRSLEKAWVRWLFVVGALGFIVFVAVQFDERSKDDPEFGISSEFVGPQAEIKTLHHQFRFPAKMRPRITSLAHDADAQLERVSTLLGAPAGDSISVNLSKPSSSHAGSATWNAIRLDPRAAYDDTELNRTLLHEISHVVGLRASDRRLESHASTFRFFDEGLAEYVALELAPKPNRARAYWLQSALLRKRENVEFAQLLDFPTFVQKFGEPALYPLGFTWVTVLVDQCGADAPRRILAALARPDVERDSSGEPLLRSVLQAARCDSSQVLNEWGKRLDSTSSERKLEVDAVPLLLGSLQPTKQGDWVVRAMLEGKPLEGGLYHLRVRARGDDALEDQAVVPGDLDAAGQLEFSVPEDYVVDHAVDFQFVVSWLSDDVLVEHAQQWRHARVTP